MAGTVGVPEDRTEKQCLSHDGSGKHTRQRQCLWRTTAVEHTRQRRCLTEASLAAGDDVHDGDGLREALCSRTSTINVDQEIPRRNGTKRNAGTATYGGSARRKTAAAQRHGKERQPFWPGRTSRDWRTRSCKSSSTRSDRNSPSSSRGCGTTRKGTVSAEREAAAAQGKAQSQRREAAAAHGQKAVSLSHRLLDDFDQAVLNCSTTTNGISLWQNGSGGARKGGVSRPHRRPTAPSGFVSPTGPWGRAARSAADRRRRRCRIRPRRPR